MLDAVLALRDELVARGPEIDAARQLPQDLAERLATAGAYRLLVPADLGGLDVGPAVFCRICESLAEANGSAAWCVFIGSTSQYLFGALPAAQVEEMLADPDVITSGVFADSGTITAAERDGRAGWVVQGHWRWGSGCRNAAWISGGVHEVDAAGEPVGRAAPFTRVYLRPDEVEIEDSWHTSGLRGSGSSDYRAEGVWVPAERAATAVEDGPFADRALYRFPRFGLLAVPIGAVCLGMARGAIDEAVRIAGGKTPQGSRRSLALRPAVQAAVAGADVELLAARRLLYGTIEDVWATVTAGGEATVVDRARLRTATVHAVQTAGRVIDRMYTLVGGTSVYESSCLQRHFRDVHVASQHMMVGEPVLEVAGRVLLGLDDHAPGL